MKIKNKKTGEIVDLTEGVLCEGRDKIVVKPVAVSDKEYRYDSLAEFCEEWGDYEDPTPKEFWSIENPHCQIVKHLESDDKTDWFSDYKETGNYFKTREDAELAIKKLKAWKVLKDNGFKFTGFFHTGKIYFEYDHHVDHISELKLLFGDEE